MEKLQAIAGTTYDLPVAEKEKKKFTNKCRLFVGNLTDDTTMEEFEEMFKVFGEIAEPYVNLEKAFGFVKLVSVSGVVVVFVVWGGKLAAM